MTSNAYLGSLRMPRWLAATLVMVLLASMSAWQPPAALAQDQSVAATIEGDDRLLAGEGGVLRLSATGSGDWGYNLGFVVRVPLGLAPQGSEIGLPRVIEDPDDDGRELWIFEDVADLPAGGTFDLDVEVAFTQPAQGDGETSDPEVFPVGSIADIELDAYTSSDPNLLPWFEGS